MEDTGLTIKALLLLVVALGALIGTLVVSPAGFVLLVTVLAWLNLGGLVLLTRV